jgi:hypothetical protein
VSKNLNLEDIFSTFYRKFNNFYTPFCVQAKIIKLVGLKNGGRLSPINLVTFAGTQNGEYTFILTICNLHNGPKFYFLV